MNSAVITSGLSAALDYTTPLLCACLAGLWSERAGIVDIALEGKLLVAAFAAAVAASASGSAYIGLLAGILASLALAFVHGYAAIDRNGNQIVSGAALNMVASGLTALVGNAWYHHGGRTPPLAGAARFRGLHLPGSAALAHVPWIGPLYAQVISGHALPVYAALALVPITAYVLKATRFGLRLRAVGENPAAVDNAGISVRAMRYAGVAMCGLYCGIGGTYLSVAANAGFLRDMTAGTGFIALAALVFAKWRPWPALATCFVFGLLNAIADRLQGLVLPGLGKVPVQAVQALPYLATVILLSGFIGAAVAPRASGVPYIKARA